MWAWLPHYLIRQLGTNHTPLADYSMANMAELIPAPPQPSVLLRRLIDCSTLFAAFVPAGEGAAGREERAAGPHRSTAGPHRPVGGWGKGGHGAGLGTEAPN